VDPVQPSSLKKTDTSVARDGLFERLLRNGAITINRWFPILYFGFFYIFVQWYVAPDIIFSGNGIGVHHYVAQMHKLAEAPKDSPTFEDAVPRKPFILDRSSEFIRETLLAPGGAIHFLTTALLYLCNIPLLGALLITVFAFLFFRIFRTYLRGFGDDRTLVLHYLPPLFILLICIWYELHYCALFLTIAGALAAAVFYRNFRPAGIAGTIILLSLLFWMSWYVLQWGCLLTLLLIFIHEMFNRRSAALPVAVIFLVNILLFWILETRILPLELTTHWKELTAESGIFIMMTAFFPVAAILVGMRSIFFGTPRSNPSLHMVLLPALCLICGTAAVIVWFCNDPVNRDTRTVARTYHHILNRQWEPILRENTTAMFKGFPQKTGAVQAFMVHAVDRALCNTGHMGDRLFYYPQAVFSYDPLLMLPTTLKNGYINWVVVLDLAMDLGMVNLAEKIAGEIMENMGPYPEILYRRATIQIAAGNSDAAAVYLNRLARMPFYGKRARQLSAKIDKGKTAAVEPRIASMQMYKDTLDYLLFTESYESMLKYLLRSNTANKAAYDYLMTHCLLIGQIDGIAALAPAATEFGYSTLPRYWEEALCIVQTSNQIPEQTGQISHLVRPQTIERFTEFAQNYMPLANDPAAARKLASAFGDSYFYFSIFRYSPGVRHE
jgi:hypothetical protein